MTKPAQIAAAETFSSWRAKTNSIISLFCEVVESAVDPTVNDDISLYDNGTLWVNNATGTSFVLVDNTNAAAVWVQIGATVGAIMNSGTVPLAAHWSVGDFQIQFGETTLSPFTVASSIVVTGLNSELLGGQTSAYHRARANHTGTQLLSTISDAAALAAKSSIATADIDPDAVTYSKIQNITTNNVILGNTAGAGGIVAELTVAQIKTLLAYVLSDISGVTITTPAAGEILQRNVGNTDWINQTKEQADIVDRLVPAFETTPYVDHVTKAARVSGTEVITCENSPSIRLPIGGNNVTISLTVPALTFPVRGLNGVKLAGKILVKMNGAYSGLTVTTTAVGKLGTFPKGTAPVALDEYGILVWEWFDDGTNDFMWAEWVNDV